MHSLLQLARRIFRFGWRVLNRFHKNKGWLLASAVAFNALLSLVPLLGLVLVIMAHFVDGAALLEVVRRNVQAAVPQAAPLLTEAIAAFLEQRALASGAGAFVVIFFGALAFRTLDDALSSILDAPRPERRRRHRLLALALPLLFMGLVVGALVVLSLLVTLVDVLPDQSVHVLGLDLSLISAYQTLMRIVAFVALIALFASFYRVMPEADVSTRYALAGGVVAACLWEMMRRALAWYFANVSLVGLIYGSLTTVIVLLLTFEVGALILLLGGQIIAEFLRSTEARLPWYEEPDGAPSPKASLRSRS